MEKCKAKFKIGDNKDQTLFFMKRFQELGPRNSLVSNIKKPCQRIITNKTTKYLQGVNGITKKLMCQQGGIFLHHLSLKSLNI